MAQCNRNWFGTTIVHMHMQTPFCRTAVPPRWLVQPPGRMLVPKLWHHVGVIQRMLVADFLLAVVPCNKVKENSET